MNALVLDDQRIFSESFSIVLEKYKLFSNVVSFSEISDLIDYLVRNYTKNTVIFADYYLENDHITAYLNQIKNMASNSKIIILSCISNPSLILELTRMNIHGIISKNEALSEIRTCIEHLESNKKYFSPFVLNIINEYEAIQQVIFTPREIQILSYFAKGHTVDKTAENLNLSRHTIAAHRRKMMAKINCSNITELLSYARNEGLIE
jgi:DNA-binding NarL/FixJ family response regulator